MHGWRELADRVAVVERSLSPAEREHAAIFAGNYGEAAAIEVFGAGGPPVISGHNAYYLWGPHGSHPVLIIVGATRLDRAFRDVRRAQTVDSPYVMPYEDHLPIFVARDPRFDLRAIWPKLRMYQ
jgi:hypothetical protein